MSELIKVDSQDRITARIGGEIKDVEADRNLRVIIIPSPYLHSADKVPEIMRFAVLAEPPLTAEEAEQITDKVRQNDEVKDALRLNAEESLGDIGFVADHLGMQQKHLKRGAALASIAIDVLEVKIARIIFNKLVPNEELELYTPEEFDDASDHHLEPRHYVLVQNL